MFLNGNKEWLYPPPYFTEIQDDVWIGQDVMICPSKKIGKGCVVAARTVVTKDFPPYTVIGGNPSQALKRYNVSTNQWEKVKK